jgi:hypothetical protein
LTIPDGITVEEGAAVRTHDVCRYGWGVMEDLEPHAPQNSE